MKTTRRITIDPITRLEGHGKIDILLNAEGNVDRAYYQIPELRGLTVFSRGRPVDDMPQITSRFSAYARRRHMAATKALDALYQVEPTPVARKLRELIYKRGVDEAAKAMIRNGVVNDGLLNLVEMAFRAYDPCNACATHAQGTIPIEIRIVNAAGEIVRRIAL